MDERVLEASFHLRSGRSEGNGDSPTCLSGSFSDIRRLDIRLQIVASKQDCKNCAHSEVKKGRQARKVGTLLVPIHKCTQIRFVFNLSHKLTVPLNVSARWTSSLHSAAHGTKKDETQMPSLPAILNDGKQRPTLENIQQASV